MMRVWASRRTQSFAMGSVGGAGRRLLLGKRCFGNAPSRVRPVEVPIEQPLRQSEREVNPSLVVVFVIVVPLWLFALSAGEQEKKRESVKAWALAQRELHHTPGAEVGERGRGAHSSSAS